MQPSLNSASPNPISLNHEKEWLSKVFNAHSEINAEIVGVEFEGCQFQDCNFTETVFKKCKFIDCSFLRCNLSLMKVAQSQFTDVLFDACKLIGVDWTRAAWSRLRLSASITFNQCILNDSSFFGLMLDEIVMEECKAQDVDFRDGSFAKAVFCHTDFTNSLFGKTNLTGADFSEATNYDIDIFSNKISKARFSRYESVRLLNCLDIELVE